MARRSSKNPPAGVTVGRRGARGGKVEVTELDPKCLQMLPTCSLSITEASPVALDQRFDPRPPKFFSHRNLGGRTPNLEEIRGILAQISRI